MNQHINAPQRCEEVTSQPFQKGFNRVQADKLRSKKGLKNISEEARWKAVYLILFPDDPREGIPSPCKFTDQVEASCASVKLIFFQISNITLTALRQARSHIITRTFCDTWTTVKKHCPHL